MGLVFLRETTLNMNDTMTNPPVSAGAGEDSTKAAVAVLGPTDLFVHRHIGPDEAEQQEMLRLLGYSSLEELIDATVPPAIRLKRELKLGPERGEHELLLELAGIAKKNNGDSAEHPGESGLVYAVHALPSGDQPRAVGGFA